MHRSLAFTTTGGACDTGGCGGSSTAAFRPLSALPKLGNARHPLSGLRQVGLALRGAVGRQ
ncbi:MAG TPA: hypothetical protein VM120_15080 [Bryobacteraceae bacterium]|nr:hypothetical protein [Bryobacteraceae bacterium]